VKPGQQELQEDNSMAPIVIYGKAVQDARNALRSAQISTMFDVLAAVLFKPASGGSASAIAKALVKWVNELAELDDTAGTATDQGRAKAANAALAHAQTRAAQFAVGGKIQDVFAIGDVLRAAGEYFELGGNGANAEVNEVDAFREGLRNQIAFNRANRARRPVSNFALSEHPDLGIFKIQLLDRSTVKYMERFYGPYIGADISGTTTDALDVLAYFSSTLLKTDLQDGAKNSIGMGEEMVPIATMVLQYHHSLIECGLALALPSAAMSEGKGGPTAAIGSFNLYDYLTLVGSASADIIPVIQRGNQTLDTNLARSGLVVLRDAIDIQGNPYADVEIGLLVDDPVPNPLFDLPANYQKFAEKRRDLMLLGGDIYQRSDPSLAAIAEPVFETMPLGGTTFAELIRMNSVDLTALKGDAGRGRVFSSLDDALAQIRAATGPASGAGVGQAAAVSSGSHLEAVSPSKGQDMVAMLKTLDPKAVAALQKLLAAV
jgi:hypothetical protein